YIKVLGHRNDINNLLMITDIGLLISIREGLPRSVMEMMAMEIPVIVTKIRGNVDLINHNSEGLHVPVKDPSKIKESLLSLINNRNKRLEMGTKARKKVIEDFELERILEAMDEIYSLY